MLEDLRSKILNSQFYDSIEEVITDISEDNIYRQKHGINISSKPFLSPLTDWNKKEDDIYLINKELQKNILYKSPTPIQAQTIPYILNKKEFIAISYTGSGKTLAYVIPLIELILRDGDRAVVLAPTKELAYQIKQVFKSIKPEIQVCLLVGGHSLELQLVNLNQCPAVIIGTPGRLAEIGHMGMSIEGIKHLIIDEYDRIISDKVFITDYKFITSELIPTATCYYFSATTKVYKPGLLRIEVGDPGSINVNIVEEFIETKEEDKLGVLKKILDGGNRTIVFCNTVKRVDWLCKKLGIYRPKPLHSRLSKRGCLDNLNFKVYIATDLASRGLHLEGLELVINYDCPLRIEDYVHRIGRTGRFMVGKAITFLNKGERINK